MAAKKQTRVQIVKNGEEGTTLYPPLYSSRPGAGFPTPGDDEVERPLDINELLVQNPSATFFVRVEGDSMEGAGIYAGDILVVDRSVVPKDNKVVVAAVYGEMVVKRLTTFEGRKALVSENEEYEPIFIHENDECHIWGVVIGSIRRF